MVEVLVAVLILAIGLIGLAALQAAGLRNNQTAYFRSVATELAYDIADRMRANPVGVRDSNYNHGQAASSSTCVNSDSTPLTADVIAGCDLYQWNMALASKLPGGTGVVCLDSSQDIGDSSNPTNSCDGSGQVYAIKIWWNDDRKGSTTQGFETSFRP